MQYPRTRRTRVVADELWVDELWVLAVGPNKDQPIAADGLRHEQPVRPGKRRQPRTRSHRERQDRRSKRARETRANPGRRDDQPHC